MVGCGFDADVVDRLHRAAQRPAHHATGPTPGQSSSRSAVTAIPMLRVYCESDGGSDGDADASRLAGRSWSTCRAMPAGCKLAPDAVGTDGLLDVCTFGNGSLWHGAAILGLRGAADGIAVLSDCQRAARHARADRVGRAGAVSIGWRSGRHSCRWRSRSCRERLTLLAPRARMLASSGFDRRAGKPCWSERQCPTTPPRSVRIAAAAANRCWSSPGRA